MLNPLKTLIFNLISLINRSGFFVMRNKPIKRISTLKIVVISSLFVFRDLTVLSAEKQKMFVANISLIVDLFLIIFFAPRSVSGLDSETLTDVKERLRGLNLKTSAFNVPQ